MKLWEKIKLWWKPKPLQKQNEAIIQEIAEGFQDGIVRNYLDRRYHNPFVASVLSGEHFEIPEDVGYNKPEPSRETAIKLLEEDRKRRSKLPEQPPYKRTVYTPPMPPITMPAINPTLSLPIVVALGAACF